MVLKYDKQIFLKNEVFRPTFSIRNLKDFNFTSKFLNNLIVYGLPKKITQKIRRALPAFSRPSATLKKSEGCVRERTHEKERT
jgi:hypothetical protein